MKLVLVFFTAIIFGPMAFVATPDDVITAAGPPFSIFLDEAESEETLVTVRLDTEETEFSPEIIVLCCSEMPVSPHVALGTTSGSLLVFRNMGNVVSLAGEKPDSIEIAGIEYAANKMGLKYIIVLGHKGCGVVKSVIDNPRGAGHLPAIYQVISKSVTEAEKSAGGNSSILLETAIKNNVKNSMTRLESDEFTLADLIKNGSLHIGGAVYNPETGKAEPLE